MRDGNYQVNEVLGHIVSQKNRIDLIRLADKFSITRKELNKCIEKLKREEYEFKSLNSHSLEIISSPDCPYPWEVQTNLKTRDLGTGYYLHFKKLESTQKKALDILAAEQPAKLHGTVIVSESQKKGRGRRGNRWISNKGGLWLSIIIKPDIPVTLAGFLFILSSVAVRETINEIAGIKTLIKWPNDIMISGRKVSGILIDVSVQQEHIDYAVIGIGINVNNKISKISSYISKNGNTLPVTSISNELRMKISRISLMRTLLEKVEKYLSLVQQGMISKVLALYKRNCQTLGKQVALRNTRSLSCGKAIDISQDGQLVVEVASGEQLKISLSDSIMEKNNDNEYHK